MLLNFYGIIKAMIDPPPKFLITIVVLLGGTIGGYIPALWGDSMFSMTSIIFSGVGAIAALVILYKYNYS